MPDETAINLTVTPASSEPKLEVSSAGDVVLDITPASVISVDVEIPAPLALGVQVPAPLNLNITAAAGGNGGSGGGSGTVTSVSVTSANGVSGTVATATTTPAISLVLGDITPSSVASVGSVSGFNLSGTNTGDQTNISGNAATATLAATVTTNANLTGPVTSVGNATAIANGAISNAMLANSAVANLSGINSGDQTSIVGITGTLAEFNTALTGADFATGGGTVSGTSSGTNTGDQTSVSGNAGTATALATGRTISVSTDATGTSAAFDGTSAVTIPVTLATVNSNLGTFGSTTKASVITVGAKGLVTAASESTVTPAVGSVTGLGTGVATALAINTGTSGAFVVNSTTVAGHALTSNVSVSASDVGLTTMSQSGFSASTLLQRDSNANASANNFLSSYAETATAAGTTNLVVSSAAIQKFTGSSTQTVNLASAATFTTGHQFLIINESSGTVTVKTADTVTMVTLLANTSAILTCTTASGTTESSWSRQILPTHTNNMQSTVNGLFAGLGTLATGDIFYYDGSNITRLAMAAGTNNYLKGVGSAAPSWAAFPTGLGDVTGPATNTDLYIPAWNGANSKTLLNGYPHTSDPSTAGSNSALVQYYTGGVLQAAAINWFEGNNSPVASVTSRIVFVNFNGTSAANITTATYSRTLTTVTVTLTAHGYIAGNIIYIDFTSGGALDGVYTIASIVDANTFTVTTAASGTIAAGSTMTLQRRTINASSGIHDVAYVSTGLYIVNFSTAMSDANYAITSGVGTGTGADASVLIPTAPASGADQTTTAFRARVSSSAAVTDYQRVSFVIVR